MKKKPVPVVKLSQPLLSDLVARGQAQAKATIAKISNAPLPASDQPALYQELAVATGQISCSRKTR